MLKTNKINMVELQDWDELVSNTYNKVYSFQQQDGCKYRGLVHMTIPSEYDDDDVYSETIPEEVNGSEMGVKFDSWLKRDRNLPFADGCEDWELEMFWERNFYPCPNKLADDLYKKGLIEKGKYIINIDW